MGALVLLSGVGESLDQQFRSSRDSLRSHAASGEVHVVEIDARSLDRIGRWPLPRSVHGALIDQLHDAGARSIAFDVDFSAVSEPSEDAKMAAALKRAGGSVILPTISRAAGSGSAEFNESAPIKPFRDHAFLGAVNVVPDTDGFIRRMLLGVETFGVPRPALPTLLAESTAKIGQSFDVDYAIEPSSIPRHSLIDVIDGKVLAGALAGKRVIIGGTAIEIGDRYPVPRYGVIPGVVIQALAAETLLKGKVPETWNGAWLLGMVLLLTGWTLRPGLRARRISALAGAAVAIPMLPIVPEAFFAATVAVAPALAAALAAVGIAAAGILADRARERALTDPDTGLPNTRALVASIRSLPRASIVVARIDRFAAIASGLGPDAAGKLILRVADRLRYANGERDIFRTDEASLAWLEDAGEEATLGQRLDALAAVMRAPVECGRPVDVPLTFGHVRADGQDTKQAVANATLAAQQASRKGTRWESFTEADGAAADWQLSLVGELKTALASGEIHNWYQPKLDLISGEVVGAEALVRWVHPTRGAIMPDSFIPLIEEHGRARDLTAHVIGQALQDALDWQASGFTLGVAVNVSATLLADHEFIEMVGQTLQASGLPTSRVTIEVTESAAMNDPKRAIAALESWSALGVSISIDDYGTGQSSLAYLQKLPATELKIDKSFVQTIGSDRRNAIMVRSTVALAHELGMRVVAEGIEDAECLQLLSEMGCDTAQGYHIGRPMSASMFAAFVAERSRRAA